MTDRPPPRLTVALLDALDGRPPHTLIPAAAGSAVQGVLTAGVWPALALPAQLRKAMRWREQIVERLIDWASVNLGDDAALRVRAGAGSRLPHAASVASTCLALAGVAAAAWLAITLPSEVGRLWYIDPFRSGGVATAAALPLGVFLLSIGGGFVLHWVAANLHLRQGRAVLTATREAMDLQPGKRPPAWEWGLRPVATILGGVLAWVGLTWALPMTIATKAHGRVIAAHDRQLLKGLAAAVRAGAARARPALDLPGPADRTEIGCPNPSCDALLPEDAAFCPRCGRSAQPKTVAAGSRLA